MQIDNPSEFLSEILKILDSRIEKAQLETQEMFSNFEYKMATLIQKKYEKENV